MEPGFFTTSGVLSCCHCICLKAADFMLAVGSCQNIPYCARKIDLHISTPSLVYTIFLFHMIVVMKGALCFFIHLFFDLIWLSNQQMRDPSFSRGSSHKSF